MSDHLLDGSGVANLDLLEDMYEKFLIDPKSVDSSWQQLFSSMENSSGSQVVNNKYFADKQLRIAALIDAYRTYGHLQAKINPIAIHPLKEPWQLSLKTLGFSEKELSDLFPTAGLFPQTELPLSKIVDALKEIYCGNIGVEYMGTQNPELEKWLQQHIEPSRFKTVLTIEQKKIILQHLNKSELLENFIHTKFVGQKRFSLEGGETLIPMLAITIDTGADHGQEEFVLGMAHRGRLNVLCNILNKSYEKIFSEFEDRYIPNTYAGSGDVKYHKGFSSTLTTSHGKKIRIDLAPNPSHLEAVDPVVEGQTRAKQVQLSSEDAKKRVIPILIHGDAALAGQGIIYETLQMYGLEGYSNGGTLHFVVNNQVGFTTNTSEARSTFYCTDIARSFNAPVFHVNAEDPESCVYATILAATIRQKFHCDVFIDLNCWRKYGHNESDEPAFTQPIEYQLIKQKKPIRETYRDDLIQQGVLEQRLAESLEIEFKKALQQSLEGSSHSPAIPVAEHPENHKEAEEEHLLLQRSSTGLPLDIITAVATKMCAVPTDFNLHPKLQNLMQERIEMAKGNKSIDWGMSEMLAYGTLLAQGISVRLSGQDCGRGTFSHRHARWTDQNQEKDYYSLQHIKEGQGRFDVINSHLSEYAVLGFEYGYSLSIKKCLVIWEAQFGDFSNGAQVIIDQFIATGEQKWGQKSGLTLLLPHGYEGQGPEHSSARIERFLQLAANNNMFVVNPSTPAQLFHLLRRQALRETLKPLIVFTPKGLLRHPRCTNTIQELTEGAFQEVLDDPSSPSQPKKIVFCSGRIYYDLIAEREKRQLNNIVLIRIEQLYPLHKQQIKDIISKYNGYTNAYWVQEEPRNMGAWEYIQPELQQLLPTQIPLTYVGRQRSAATATGSLGRHKKQHETIMETLFGASS